MIVQGKIWFCQCWLQSTGHGRRYEARGLFLDPPTAGLVKGRWRLRLPDGPAPAVPPSDLEFAFKDELFSLNRRVDVAIGC